MDFFSRKAIRSIVGVLGLLVLAALFASKLAQGQVQAAHPTEDENASKDAGSGEEAIPPHDVGGSGFDVTQLMEHVLGSHEFELLGHREIHLPWWLHKMVLIEFISVALILLFYLPLAYRASSGTPPRGAFANSMEVLLTFVRNDIAKPTLGEDADRFVPFLWTLFLFILFNNLLGMFPFLGSPTASPWVTLALALIVFFAIHGAAIAKMRVHGHGHDHEHGHEQHSDHHHGEPVPAGEQGHFGHGFMNYMKSMWPQLDLPFPFGPIIKPLVFVLEVQGVLVRNLVLAIRLFANMFAGHMVLATILFFIQMSANSIPLLWGTVTVSSVVGIVALSLLEIFVAFLQAFIFVFLASLFMGMALNPQH
jgi:F-type H+-transporting ATPase subunit a